MVYRQTEAIRARKAAQRAQLLRAAEELVREGGFARLTMASLAQRAGVGVGTLYRTFDVKGALAAEVFRRVTQREVNAVEDAMRQAGSVAERLAFAVESFVARAQAAPQLAWSLIAEPIDPAVEVERLRYRRAYTRLYAGLLEEGMETGELPAQDPGVAAAALVGAIAESLVGPLSTPRSEQVAPALVDFCLRAVGARNSEKKHGGKR